MLNEHFYSNIIDRVTIGHPYCPHCKKEVAIHEKMLQCCGVTAETVLIVEPPVVDKPKGFQPPEVEPLMVIDPHAVEPSLIAKREPKKPLRTGWIGYLPKIGHITQDVFRSFAEYQMQLPVCPRCRQPFEFRKDQSDTEKPYCPEATCQVLFCPCHFPQGSIGKWSLYDQPSPLEKDEFRLEPKKYDSPYGNPQELRSIGLVSYWQEVAMYAAASVKSAAEGWENNIIGSTSANDTPPSPTVKINETAVDNRQPPADVSPTSQTTQHPDDSCCQFIQSVIYEDEDAFITRDALYTAYQRWCENTQNICLTRRELFQRLREMKNVSEPRRRIDGSDPIRGFLGIRLL